MSDTPDFEQSLQELERLVANLEQGELSLEQSLQTFERGVQLSRICQQHLSQAEQRVQILLEQNAPTPSTTTKPDAQ